MMVHGRACGSPGFGDSLEGKHDEETSTDGYRMMKSSAPSSLLPRNAARTGVLVRKTARARLFFPALLPRRLEL